MKRYIVEIIPRGQTGISGQDAREALETALNDPARSYHELNGIYAIESATVIVWRADGASELTTGR